MARTAELVVRAEALAERMRARRNSPTLSSHLATLDDAVGCGQRYLRQLAGDHADAAIDAETGGADRRPQPQG